MGVVKLTPDDVLSDSYPPKVTLAKMAQLEEQGLLEVGVSLRTAWLSDAGHARLEALSKAR
jgi:hypothetical protein